VSEPKPKSFEISKRAVWEAYRRVKANKGAAGVDEQSIEEFEQDVSANLYKLWNRLSSGSYFRRSCCSRGSGERRLRAACPVVAGVQWDLRRSTARAGGTFVAALRSAVKGAAARLATLGPGGPPWTALLRFARWRSRLRGRATCLIAGTSCRQLRSPRPRARDRQVGRCGPPERGTSERPASHPTHGNVRRPLFPAAGARGGDREARRQPASARGADRR
jgi:hypothetical protein